MKTTWTMKLALALSIALSALSTNLKAQDNDGCSNVTLKGDYAFTVSGTFWTGPNNSIAVQRAGVAMTHFDGAGNLSQVDYVLSSPNAPIPPGTLPVDPITKFHINEKGTYTVHADCTGTFTIVNPDFVDTTIPGPVITVQFVLSHGGKSIHTVVSSLVVPSPNGPVTVPALIQSEGHKLGPIEVW